MRILVLQTAKLNIVHKMYSACLGKIHDITYYGEGFVEDYNPNISIFEILERYPKFDLILSNAKGCYINDLNKIIDIPKIIAVADYFGWRQRQVNDWLTKGRYDLAFVFNDHWTATEIRRTGLVSKIHYVPLCIDKSVFYQTNLSRDIDVMAVFSTFPKYYSLREFVKNTVRGMIDVRTETRKLAPDDYADCMRRSKIFVSSGDRIGSVFPKGFEAMACGTLYITDWATDMVTCGLRSGEHLGIFAGPFDLEEKIRYYLVHKEERERIAEAGRRYILKNFTLDHGMQYFTETVEKELL